MTALNNINNILNNNIKDIYNSTKLPIPKVETTSTRSKQHILSFLKTQTNIPKNVLSNDSNKIVDIIYKFAGNELPNNQELVNNIYELQNGNKTLEDIYNDALIQNDNKSLENIQNDNEPLEDIQNDNESLEDIQNDNEPLEDIQHDNEPLEDIQNDNKPLKDLYNNVLMTNRDVPLVISSPPNDSYINQVFDLRTKLANRYFRSSDISANNNGDEAEFLNDLKYPLAGNFTKGFPHDLKTGFIKTEWIPKYVEFIESLNKRDSIGVANALADIPNLVDPQGGLFLSMEGMPAPCIHYNEPAKLRSGKRAVNLLECYATEIARDIPFCNYKSDLKIKTILDIMNQPAFLEFYAGPKDITTIKYNHLFRGFQFNGDHQYSASIGPYVSQFLLRNYSSGEAFSTPQKYRVPKTAQQCVSEGLITDFGVKPNDLKWLQDGNVLPDNKNRYESENKYIYNGRSLAEIVHNDPFMTFSHNASSQLRLMKCPLNESWNKLDMRGQAMFSSLVGPPSMDELIAKAQILSLRTTWYAKWLVFRTLRPEAMSILVQNFHDGDINSPIHTLLKNSPLIDEIKIHHKELYKRDNSYSFSSCWPEGSPSHPSYLAGHATSAGAFATILKAIFGSDKKWVDVVGTNTISGWKVVEANNNGTSLQEYIGDDINLMTVNSEIDKLASNIAHGRMMGSCHYREDNDNSLLIGEQVAIEVLRSWLTENPQIPNDFSLIIRKFDGTLEQIQKAILS